MIQKSIKSSKSSGTFFLFFFSLSSLTLHTDQDIEGACRLLGTPTTTTWPGLSQMPDFKTSFPIWRPSDWDKVLPEMEPQGLELIKKLLIIDPEKRISGEISLNSNCDRFRISQAD